MIDFVVRDCGNGEFFPIIVVVGTTKDSRFGNGEELYRGERVPDPVQAFNRARMIWFGSASQTIAAFKKERKIP